MVVAWESQDALMAVEEGAKESEKAPHIPVTFSHDPCVMCYVARLGLSRSPEGVLLISLRLKEERTELEEAIQAD